ncbi:MAG: adenylyltransferase/cytidyltransferase family protein [Sedimentisphaerales bacterium]|nr:adenylyltransferase/cytidyltransferase family protein [Sedimentisphaerales bacterium]
MWNDKSLRSVTGKEPKFPQEERFYFLQAVRYVSKVYLTKESADFDKLLLLKGLNPFMWIERQSNDTSEKQTFCRKRGLEYRILSEADLEGFPDTFDVKPSESPRKKVLVTGCYDWFHSGHVRFFEEVSELGDLYVVVGHDANVRALKGPGHPMLPQDERCYMAQSIRYVKQAFISTGQGWLDAEPEIKRIKPDIYAVNEDGDKSQKREYCRDNGIDYVVLKRLPKAGLPRRESTVLRGF